MTKLVERQLLFLSLTKLVAVVNHSTTTVDNKVTTVAHKTTVITVHVLTTTVVAKVAITKTVAHVQVSAVKVLRLKTMAHSSQTLVHQNRATNVLLQKASQPQLSLTLMLLSLKAQ